MGDAATPSASIVIPVYNGARFLAQAIESCLAQDHRADEIIVVDDGSTDASVDIARGFAAVRVLELDANRGPATARNRGAEVSRGAVLVFHDADDVMTRHRLAVQLHTLLERPACEVLLGRQRHLVEPGQEVPGWARAELGRDEAVGVPLGVVTVRRESFERVRGFNPAFRVGEDSDFLVRCRAAGIDITVLDDVIVERRIHADNTMHTAHRSGEVTRALLRSIATVARERRERAIPDRDR